ncbi:MAG: MarR family winged helix-turn-helix transcriptional regulator [Candidatus Dormibacteria bacterium]
MTTPADLAPSRAASRDARATALAATLPGLLQRFGRRLREASGPLGIAVGHYPVLVGLLERRAATVTELASQERMRVPSMTALLIQLEASGLVRKRVDPNDRRCILVSLTPKGASVARAARKVRAEWLGQRLRHLTTAEITVLARSLPVLEHLIGLDR